MSKLLSVKVWGEYACFTRPEMTVERVSYPLPTPSAARGILESILWKPEMDWRVHEIHVLKPIKHISFLRNEGKKKATLQSIQPGHSYVIADYRTQRYTLALRDVAYVIKAEIVLRQKATDSIIKYREQFRRRVSKGQCFHQPFLGCKEFAAFFGPANGDEQPVDVSDEIGMMLHEINYNQYGNEPVFFRARLESGVLRVPQDIYAGVRPA